MLSVALVLCATLATLANGLNIHGTNGEGIHAYLGHLQVGSNDEFLATESTVAAIETAVGTTNTKLDTLDGSVDAVTTAVGTTNTKLDTLDSTVAGVETAVSGVSAKLPDSLGRKADTGSLSIVPATGYSFGSPIAKNQVGQSLLLHSDVNGTVYFADTDTTGVSTCVVMYRCGEIDTITGNFHLNFMVGYSTSAYYLAGQTDPVNNAAKATLSKQSFVSEVSCSGKYFQVVKEGTITLLNSEICDVALVTF